MKETFFRKTDLSAIFTKALKEDSQRKDFLMDLWNKIKEKEIAEAKACVNDCSKCYFRESCSAMADASQFLNKFCGLEDTDDYWNRLVQDSTEYCKKYNDNQFARNMIYEVMKEISLQARNLPGFNGIEGD